jgi:transcriptional regulator, AraC family
MKDKVISEVLDRQGFGSNVQLVAEDEGCKVLRLEAPTGEGFMSLYLVSMPGIYVMFK